MAATTQLKKEVKYKMVIPKFFSPKDAQELLMKYRKQQAILQFEKVDGTFREIEAFICYSETKHQFIINEELDSIISPSFKTIPLSRLISVTVDGKKYQPRRKKVLYV